MTGPRTRPRPRERVALVEGCVVMQQPADAEGEGGAVLGRARAIQIRSHSAPFRREPALALARRGARGKRRPRPGGSGAGRGKEVGVRADTGVGGSRWRRHVARQPRGLRGRGVGFDGRMERIHVGIVHGHIAAQPKSARGVAEELVFGSLLHLRRGGLRAFVFSPYLAVATG